MKVLEGWTLEDEKRVYLECGLVVEADSRFLVGECVCALCEESRGQFRS